VRRGSLIERTRSAVAPHGALLANASSMVGATLINSLLGVAFWFVAAHHFSVAAVGVAGAAVSAMTLLGFTGTIGLGTLLMGELPRRPEGRRALLGAALIAAGVAGSALGLGFALIAPLASDNLDPLSATWLAAISFAAGTGLTSLGLVLDQSLIGLLRGGLQLGRNTIFAVVKLAALIAVAAIVANPSAPWIYSAWGFGVIASLAVLIRVYRGRGKEQLRPDFSSLHEMRGSAASHASVNLALETADLAMPIIVVMLLTAAENASFYIAWLIVNFLVMIPFSLSSVAYALGSGGEAPAEDRFRFTFGLSLALAALADLILIPFADPILRIFGADYAALATTTLRILALGVFPLTVKTHYVAIHRVRRTLREAMPIAWAGTLLELGGGALGAALGGLSGVAWGWLAGLLIEAVVMSGDVTQALTPPRRAAAGPGAGR
jgi:O-antigen/teichoic acid export membrane protein